MLHSIPLLFVVLVLPVLLVAPPDPNIDWELCGLNGQYRNPTECDKLRVKWVSGDCAQYNFDNHSPPVVWVGSGCPNYQDGGCKLYNSCVEVHCETNCRKLSFCKWQDGLCNTANPTNSPTLRTMSPTPPDSSFSPSSFVSTLVPLSVTDEPTTNAPTGLSTNDSPTALPSNISPSPTTLPTRNSPSPTALPTTLFPSSLTNTPFFLPSQAPTAVLRTSAPSLRVEYESPTPLLTVAPVSSRPSPSPSRSQSPTASSRPSRSPLPYPTTLSPSFSTWSPTNLNSPSSSPIPLVTNSPYMPSVTRSPQSSSNNNASVENPPSNVSECGGTCAALAALFSVLFMLLVVYVLVAFGWLVVPKKNPPRTENHNKWKDDEATAQLNQSREQSVPQVEEEEDVVVVFSSKPPPPTAAVATRKRRFSVEEMNEQVSAIEQSKAKLEDDNRKLEEEIQVLNKLRFEMY